MVVSGGGAQPHQHCKRIAKRNWIQNARIRKLNPLKILPKSLKHLQYPGPEAPKTRSEGFWAALGCLLVTRDLQDSSGTSSRRLWGGSWGRFRLILAHLGGVLGTQDGPKILPRRPKMPLRCSQYRPRSDFQQKTIKINELFEFGWHFVFDLNLILSQKYIPDF